MKKYILIISLFVMLISCQKQIDKSPLALQTDFGRKDNAVSSMYGVALTVDKDLKVYDLTHEIPAFNIWEAALRLDQTARYWPEGTVFVNVVDPGVGTERKSVVMKTTNNYYFVTPDNGSLTFVAESLGIEEVREIDEAVNRLTNSQESYTFHGRDVYVYTGARLASKQITFEQVGKSLGTNITKIDYQKPRYEEGKFFANIPILDVQYGNVWSSLPRQLMLNNGVQVGDILNVSIYNKNTLVWNGDVKLVNTFGDVAEGDNMAYFNSELNFSVAVNMGNFSDKYKVESGPDWSMEIIKK
ncbi:S-adenosyl-l-methionine hydroxide adenosyltransferase family protein [Brachyspira innocens]|uniref:S-adenosyl-l-methionine hydroxide adenosyltransferase family protein n=1 Tax=Brachyspira innocens TaxID=13264 RepID=A0ABT8Z1U3_9SPIR|nr:S-adenosyl-l-methionine hydroxide adenosyltransferase family protein [Brachyspira innocens]MDO6994064.1 S-adenosyl-l-methionine hydroxide adenosyltransferase family protein [Brachyspira innocens]MDO7021230.1 S-adenosyl-l-methionine hydroxide adenosyltransferase family protein [Brachyspira innocens]